MMASESSGPLGKRILVTGGSGFVGHPLVRFLKDQGHSVIAPTRRATALGEHLPHGIDACTDWGSFLHGVDCVVHCAGLAHAGQEVPSSAFDMINIQGTRKLAQDAVNAGVRRFVFLSSAKVNGEISPEGVPFDADGPVEPNGPYALSKYQAEQELLALAADKQIEVVILRPVLIYGAGVKANFLKLIKLASSGLPLPIGGIHNKRSFLYLGNLLEFVELCISHPRAANQRFMVSDGQDMSTAEMVRLLALSTGRRAWVFWFPPAILSFAARLCGREAALSKFVGSLQVDIEKNHELLGWSPRISTSQGIVATARHHQVKGQA